MDRTPFDKHNGDEYLILQKVPKEIYNASYPAWVFNRQKITEFFMDKGFIVLENFDSKDASNKDFYYGGNIFIKKQWCG